MLIWSLACRRCTPNTYWRWDTRTYAVHLYAARPIAEGEQLSIPYVPLLAPQEKRADQLLDRYIFRCTCPSCTDIFGESCIR